MNVDRLLQIDWKDHIPNLEGNLAGNDFDNLNSLMLAVTHENKTLDPSLKNQLLNRCKNFLQNLRNGSDYVTAARISVYVLAIRDEEFEFQDRNTKISPYFITALKKDYPDLDVKALLKTIPAEDFFEFIKFHYPSRMFLSDPLGDQDKAFRIMNELGFRNAVNNYVNFQKIPDVALLTTSEVIGLLREVCKEDKDKEFKEALLVKAREIVGNLNAKNRDDLKTVVEFSKALGSFDNDNDLKNVIKYTILSEEVYKAKDLNAFQSLIVAIANFIGISISKWIEVDRKFLYEALKDVPSLYIVVPENPPQAFWDWASHLENLHVISLPRSCTNEQFKKLPLTLEGIDISQCDNLNNDIIPHIKKMPLKRISFHSPNNVHASDTSKNFDEKWRNEIADKVVK